MANLSLVALTLAAIVAVSAVSAYRTTITTTPEGNGYWRSSWDGLDNHRNGYWRSSWDGLDNRNGYWRSSWDGLDNRRGSQEQCGSQIPIQELTYCQMHLITFDDQMLVNPRKAFNQGQQHLQQQCCSQLKRVSGQCQCDAIQQVLNQARVAQGGVGDMQQMLSKAQKLPTECSLDVQQCSI
uniref:PawS-like protein 1a n=1 Tax=Melampodium paludosum TaxID=415156 RepID=A0A1V0JB51_9ASTR|nr:PawS-like protein 1a [Melampodium paludosum]